MIYQPITFPSSNTWPQLDIALAHLTALVATIEADCATAGLQVALPHPRAALYAAIDALGGWINAFLAAGPAEAEIQAAKERVTGLIRPWSAAGPFFDRTLGKLRGYPGNFEPIEIIYNCRPSGVPASLPARRSTKPGCASSMGRCVGTCSRWWKDSYQAVPGLLD